MVLYMLLFFFFHKFDVHAIVSVNRSHLYATGDHVYMNFLIF